MVLSGGANALGRELEDRKLAHIGEFDSVAIEGLEVAAVHRGPARRKRMVFWQQLLAHGGIIDHRTDLTSDEVCRGIVGGF